MFSSLKSVAAQRITEEIVRRAWRRENCMHRTKRMLHMCSVSAHHFSPLRIVRAHWNLTFLGCIDCARECTGREIVRGDLSTGPLGTR